LLALSILYREYNDIFSVRKKADGIFYHIIPFSILVNQHYFAEYAAISAKN
jgi:hypothetical protein